LNHLGALKAAVQRLYVCVAAHQATVTVDDMFRGRTMWKGDVQVFSLDGCPGRKTCYAWFDHAPGNPARFFSVLENNYIRTAEMAVKSVLFFGLSPRPACF
jgi:hypothetical protein